MCKLTVIHFSLRFGVNIFIILCFENFAYLERTLFLIIRTDKGLV